MKKQFPRLLIGAPGSGSGKTTVVCGILQAMKNRGRKVMSFKCGPDYIDPMFHTEVLGIPSRNLDLFFTEKQMARYLLGRHSDKQDLAVIEGVMGYYDGLAGTTTEASSYDLAVSTETPAVLLIDGRGKSVSLLAEIKGFLEWKENSRIKGVILNRVSAGMYPELKQMIEENLSVKVYGFFPKLEECTLESRHLGLVTAGEIENLQRMIQVLGQQAEETIDLDGLLELAESTPLLEYDAPALPEKASSAAPVKIGVAMDRAFCFYYQDNLQLLEELGAELKFFSPLEEEDLPEGISGLIFGGGYPELYLDQLSGNQGMKNAAKQALDRNMPCIAECGGFMYLQEEIQDNDGKAFTMVGALKGKCYPTGKLGRFGYITMTAQEDNLLCRAGETLKGHEFHYWDSTECGCGFHAQKPYRKRNWDCVTTTSYLYAGYPHIHFYSNLQAAERFVEACRGYML